MLGMLVVLVMLSMLTVLTILNAYVLITRNAYMLVVFPMRKLFCVCKSCDLRVHRPSTGSRGPSDCPSSGFFPGGHLASQAEKWAYLSASPGGRWAQRVTHAGALRPSLFFHSAGCIAAILISKPYHILYMLPIFGGIHGVLCMHAVLCS